MCVAAIGRRHSQFRPSAQIRHCNRLSHNMEAGIPSEALEPEVASGAISVPKGGFHVRASLAASAHGRSRRHWFFRKAGGGADHARLQAAGARPASREGLRRSRRAGHGDRVRLAHLPSLHEFPHQDLAGVQDQIRRYRQGPLHRARVPARSALDSGVHAGALLRRGEMVSDRRHALQDAGRLGIRKSRSTR